ncbi:endomembrane protein 70 [Cooperia oncophora]
MPITFCFNNQQDVKVCTTGFPMGCYVDANGQPRDACVIDPRFNVPDSYYIFNHVDITIEYRDMTQDQNFLDGEQEDAQEEFGWKLVHGDVFRPPRNAMMLSVFIGAGCQTLLMVSITLVFACLGFLSPANRGALITFALVFYVLFGIVAGYVAARLYKTFQGVHWKTNVILTSFLIPGILFSVFFFTNILLWIKGSSAAVPFGTLLALLSLWLFISTPMTFIGAFFGFKKRAIEAPVRTNQIPRQVPEQSIYTKPLPGMLMGGILPFGCIFIQLFFILNSIWAHQTYYMFGFLFVVFLILIITCSEATILLAYFHLCAEASYISINLYDS